MGSAPDTGFPAWIDPSSDLILTPKRVKGLTHPIRLRLLELLQHEGPATATSLAARIGRSSGVTSYHLRVLADSGFIVEDTERGNARDRFWRAPHRSTGFTLRMPDDPGTAENVEDTDRYLRIVARGLPPDPGRHRPAHRQPGRHGRGALAARRLAAPSDR